MTDFDCCAPIGPDCRDGKHPACDGRAWDEHRDNTTLCACSCHAAQEAHAPTDDEREAPTTTSDVAAIIDRAIRPWGLCNIGTHSAARALIAAGLLRSEVSEHHDDGTLPKVYDALIAALPEKAEWEVRDLVNAMQNAGILFRERTPEPSTETDDEMHARGATSWDCETCGQDPEDCYCGDEPQAEPCSNPKCPLDRGHSGPCAPEGWERPEQAEPSDAQVEAAMEAYATYRESDGPGDAMRAALRAAAATELEGAS